MAHRGRQFTRITLPCWGNEALSITKNKSEEVDFVTCSQLRGKSSERNHDSLFFIPYYGINFKRVPHSTSRIVQIMFKPQGVDIPYLGVIVQTHHAYAPNTCICDYHLFSWNFADNMQIFRKFFALFKEKTTDVRSLSCIVRSVS